MKLKDCPYCGDISTLFPTPNGDHWIIKCVQCAAMMKGRREEEPRYQYLDQREALVMEWNRRER
mgnify:CR=1 FL=1